ncbi:hypothetical protein GGR58DRAFT_496698 [Xylaria digitata]|nr:hypothetical protein GGR58DRAFT_496698 [Xylaria digitata]
MKFTLALIAYPIAALAAFLPQKQTRLSALDEPFVATVWSNDITKAVVSASGGKFYIGRPTHTYCPGGVVDCSHYTGTETVFHPVYDSRLALQVDVPGGQRVYVAPDGSLSFTQAHSAYIPPGSTEVGFSHEECVKSDETYLLITDLKWYICPLLDRTYQLYASGAPFGDCSEAEIRTYAPDQGEVWQYV